MCSQRKPDCRSIFAKQREDLCGRQRGTFCERVYLLIGLLNEAHGESSSAATVRKWCHCGFWACSEEVWDFSLHSLEETGRGKRAWKEIWFWWKEAQSLKALALAGEEEQLPGQCQPVCPGPALEPDSEMRIWRSCTQTMFLNYLHRHTCMCTQAHSRRFLFNLKLRLIFKRILDLVSV